MGYRSFKIGRKNKRYGGWSSHEGDPAVDDTDKRYCRVCGFPVSTKTTARRKTTPDGMSNKWLTGDKYPTDVDGDTYSQITRYCPFCGSPDWLTRKSKVVWNTRRERPH